MVVSAKIFTAENNSKRFRKSGECIESGEKQTHLKLLKIYQ